MRSRTTASFRKAFADLPSEVQERARTAFDLFSRDPGHPGLQLKKIHSDRPIYSARITRDYRALAVRRQDLWIWFWIGTHADYENLLNRL